MTSIPEKAMGDERITQKYLRRYPDSKRTKSWAGALVHIETENGVWRVNAQGYTYVGTPEAWALPFEEAQSRVGHCGPEKRAAFIRVRPQPKTAPVVDDAEALRAQLNRVHQLAASARDRRSSMVLTPPDDIVELVIASAPLPIAALTAALKPSEK